MIARPFASSSIVSHGIVRLTTVDRPEHNEMDSSSIAAAPSLSVVIPVRNEADNVAPLADEIVNALAPVCSFEIIFVDDGSTDATVENICAVRRNGLSQLRLIRHDQGAGQSIAVYTGVRAARADWIATLDGDGQNDPADIRLLLGARDQAQAASDLRLIIGNRKTRKDTWVRRMSSRIANGVRKRMLNDDAPDTGCGIKVFERAAFLELPAFNHMHRFLPALFRRAGYRVISVPVSHRARLRGQSKYGISNRLWVGIVDMLGVRWLLQRSTARTHFTEE
jgi:dolichol-phosphate mannosyltransferase